MQPEQNPYDFIINPTQPAKQPKLPGSSSTAGRLLVVVGGVFILLILFVIVKSVLTSSSSKGSESLVAVAEQQQEIIHLSDTASQNASSSDLKNFAITTKLSLSSEQADLISYLKSNGHKLSDKQLEASTSATIDKQLTDAQSASNFDSTFRSVIKDQLSAYQASLQKAFNENKGPKGRALLSQDFDALQLLQKQLGS